MDVFLSPLALAMVRAADRSMPGEAVSAWLNAGLDIELRRMRRRKRRRKLDAKDLEGIPSPEVIFTLQGRRAFQPLKKVSVIMDSELHGRVRARCPGNVSCAVAAALEFRVSRLKHQEKIRLATPLRRRRKRPDEIKSVNVHVLMTKIDELRFVRAAAGRPLSTCIRELAIEALAARIARAARAARRAA